ncbi:MAG: hypothetical protein H7330_10200 [Hymenobacteraceae bacterium]|nr:hypothetical protein [Hymenobacteraceae bacterium]
MLPAALPTPRLLFRTAFTMPVWRMWPVTGALAVELRDTEARTVSFVILRAADGHELVRYHDPATPWWLALTGLTSTELVLGELDPTRLGQPERYRTITWSQPDVAPVEPLPDWRTPESHGADGPYFTPLAAFIEAQTGQRPSTRVDLLETPTWTVLGFESPGLSAGYELLAVAARGTSRLRLTLAGAPLGPGELRFCTFGPILYALGAPGEVLAWELPPV